MKLFRDIINHFYNMIRDGYNAGIIVEVQPTFDQRSKVRIFFDYSKFTEKKPP